MSYKATPEQWDDAGAFASGTRACLFELRSRIEALEAANHVPDATEMVASTEPIEDRAALLWVLWHHQGASSPIGQPIRRQLGMGQYDKLSLEQYAAARRFASLGEADAEQSPAAPAPAGGLVERVAHTIHDTPSGCGFENEARAAILAVAEWLDQPPNAYGNLHSRRLRQEVERG